MAQHHIRYTYKQLSSSLNSNFDNRTPRRKLFSSNEDDDNPNPVNDIIETRLPLSLIETNNVLIARQSKLEDFGFDMLPRSSTILRKQKPIIINSPVTIQSNRMQTIEVQQSITTSCLTMKTRSQSSTDSHSDHLVKLFDKTLSTVTPVRDSTNNDNNGITSSQYRRGQPLPLILSDNSHEDDMPILTLNDSGLSSNENKKRAFEQVQPDENSCGRSLKRSKVVHDEENKENAFYIPPPVSTRIRKGLLVRSLSEKQSNAYEEQIKASVELGSNRNLVGDRSRTYLLPRCASRKHADLACIRAETMIDLLQNKYSSEIEQLHIIDCRYPYEYEGGHISIAKNLFTRPQVYQEYFRSPIKLKDPSKRIVFVFHCEFSSERAPSLLRYMRSEDRNIHAHNYPALHYPELYLLEGGYKALFEHSTEFCKPNFYRTMLDEQFQEQCRQFRSFSKQSEKFTYLKEDIGYAISTSSRRTRTTLRSSLSLCFTSTSLALESQIDFS